MSHYKNNGDVEDQDEISLKFDVSVIIKNSFSLKKIQRHM
jgi:hypothetical protein